MVAMMEIILILESELELGGIGVGFMGSDLSPSIKKEHFYTYIKINRKYLKIKRQSDNEFKYSDFLLL